METRFARYRRRKKVKIEERIKKLESIIFDRDKTIQECNDKIEELEREIRQLRNIRR